MRQRGISRRLAVGISVLGVTTAATVAAVPRATAETSATRFAVVLRSPHPARLAALARANGLSHAQRLRRLRDLVPSAHDVAVARAGLAAEGLASTVQSAWTLSAVGAAARLPELDGLTARVVPTSLHRFVAAILPVATSAPTFHPTAAVAVNGAGFRDAYTAAHVTPPQASSSKPRPTVATIQLAGFNPGDLAAYAKTEHLPHIVGTARYRPVTVDGGSGSAAGSDGGDIEVALDQESILSTAPNANQRPYFAPNSGSGYVDAIAAVFDDVTQDKHATKGGDPHIVALSTSWGSCEANYGDAQIGASQTVIKALVAAGVTMFASSGDDGIYDCGDATGTGLGNSKAGVDYPASSPQVVGVGGTNLQHRGKTVKPNNGHNWKETAWSCRSPASCQGNGLLPILPNGTGGTGGGQSGATGGLLTGSGFQGFGAPSYQKKYLTGSLYGHRPKRLVPDIATDGDPQTGFDLYSSDAQVASSKDSRGLVQVGGTSLSAPMSAALLTNAIASTGRTTGVGDIHRALYRAYANARHKVFRDVTVGINGAPVNRGSDPAVRAHRGYDTLSGLGAVLWPKLLPYLVADRHGGRVR